MRSLVSKRFILSFSLIAAACSSPVDFKNDPSFSLAKGAPDDNITCDADGTCRVTIIDPSTPPDLVLKKYTGDFKIPPKVADILFVDDNSGSMAEEQTAMGTAFSSFINTLSAQNGSLDWRIGIITTDVSGTGNLEDGNLIEFRLGTTGQNLFAIDKDTPNGNQLFIDTIKRDIDEGDGDERGIFAAYRHLEKVGTGQGKGSTRNNALIRDVAHLSIVIISDEEEGSDGTSLGAKDKPENLISLVKDKWKDSQGNPLKSLSVHSIVYHDANQCSNGWGDHLSTIYPQLTELTKGILGNSCTPNYQDQISNIGNYIQEAADSFTLQCVPYNNIVVLNTVLNPSPMVVVLGDKVKLVPSPAAGTQLQFTYYCKQ